jgi:hypothetical protein
MEVVADVAGVALIILRAAHAVLARLERQQQPLMVGAVAPVVPGEWVGPFF